MSNISRDSMQEPLQVVGIGASAGGLQAIEAFFDAMPSNTGMAFVLIQHLSPDYKSLMHELLARHTHMEIVRVQEPTPLSANTVFLIPPRKNMVVKGSMLELVSQTNTSGANYPIDEFFISLATEKGVYSTAVVLSGTGSDGSRGIRTISQNGGLVLVQSVQSAAFDGMPRNAIATKCVDAICSPGEMPERIRTYLASPGSFIRDTDRDQHGPGVGTLDRIFRLFRQRYGIDFSMYKASTIDRRLERRVQFAKMANLEAYLHHIESDPRELAQLYRDLLVEVTHFFRDPPMYAKLIADVIPNLVERAGDDDTIRVWVPGCATGEEAYSLAICFHAAIEKAGIERKVKVFATDVHNESLEIASVGVYSAQSMSNVSQAHKLKYFNKHGGLFHVSNEIRRMVIFARHDLCSDPPFTRLDLISCRNLLIYLRSDIQQKILSLFHFALKVGGGLTLGPSETLGTLDTEFDSVDTRWKLFRKLRDVRLRASHQVLMASHAIEPVTGRGTNVASVFRTRGGSHFNKVLHKLLSQLLPSSLLVSAQGELLHTFGDAGQYLSQPEGPTTLELLKLLRGELRIAVSTGIYRTRQTNERTVVGRVFYTVGQTELQLRVTVDPFEEGTELYMLVAISQMEASSERPENLTTFDERKHSAQQMSEMERELDLMRESLQSTIEELETSNEELQATNEELVASNEELQSTNEELQSVNEELHTVNAEHQRKIEELVEVYNDLDHLIRATGTAILYLDKELRIRRFTDGIRQVFNLLDHDLGRPIEHISHNLVHPHILDLIRDANVKGLDSELAVPTVDGTELLLRIIPYHSESDILAGVLLTVAQGKVVARVREQARTATENSHRSNKELVEFAYAVSHDLQAGLRHLNQGVRSLLAEEPNNDDRQQDSLKLINRSAERLNEMIDALLTYSRVHTKMMEPENISLDLLLDGVMRRLSKEHELENISFERGPLPEAVVDQKQISTVFFQLIDNAIKYRRDEALKLQISATILKDVISVAIADNGQGIESRNLERVFTIFQRNHHDSDVPGLGLGLSLSRRIVERHGGRLRVESESGKGSTFFFSLPLQRKSID